MWKILLLLLLCFQSVKAEKIYYEPEPWRDDVSIYFFEVIFKGHDNKDEYLILVNNRDINMQNLKEENRKYPFYEFRCIKEDTILNGDIFDNQISDNKYYVGEKDENCNCKQFEFYEYDYNFKTKKGTKSLKPIGACQGYKDYSYKDLQNMKIIH